MAAAPAPTKAYSPSVEACVLLDEQLQVRVRLLRRLRIQRLQAGADLAQPPVDQGAAIAAVGEQGPLVVGHRPRVAEQGALEQATVALREEVGVAG